MAESLPSWGATGFPYDLAGAPPAPFGTRPKIAGLRISPNYFETVGAHLLAGREFTDADTASGVPVAVVNQLFAATYWPGKDPLGQRLRLYNDTAPGPWLTVVGVASNIIQRDLNRQRLDPVIYLPFRQKPQASMWIFGKTNLPVAGVVNSLRSEVRSIDPDVPAYGPFSMSDRLERFSDSRFYGALFLIFAVLALLLASIGLYAVIAHSVSQRTQEIGVRMAIGASANDILKFVLVQGMLPLGAGLAIGLAASLMVNRILAAALVQVSPSDPVALSVAAGVLTFAAMLGCLIPARPGARCASTRWKHCVTNKAYAAAITSLTSATRHRQPEPSDRP
jgi:hypothetical protein